MPYYFDMVNSVLLDLARRREKFAGCLYINNSYFIVLPTHAALFLLRTLLGSWSEYVDNGAVSVGRASTSRFEDDDQTH